MQNNLKKAIISMKNKKLNKINKRALSWQKL